MEKIEFIIQKGKQILCNDHIKLTSHTKNQVELYMIEKGKCHRCSNKIGYKVRCVSMRKWGWFCANDMCLTLDRQIDITKNRMKDDVTSKMSVRKQIKELAQMLYDPLIWWEEYKKRGENVVYHQKRKDKKPKKQGFYRSNTNGESPIDFDKAVWNPD